MARQNATNFTGGLQFPYATAATDLFKKEDVQTLALAVDQHDHTAGKGLSVAPTAGSVTNAMLGPDVARANLLTNGGFEIWQRGNGPFATAGAWSADRWSNSAQAGDSLSISRDTANADGAPSGACAACTFTRGGSGTSTLLNTLVVSTDYAALRGKTVTLSIRVRTSVASAVRAFLQVDSTPALGTIHTGDGTYQTLTVSAAVPAGATSVYVGVSLMATCTAYIDNACLVVGSQAVNYVPLHPADDLARCLRYYEVLYGELQGYAAAGATAAYGLSFKVPKAVSPTLTRVGTWTVTNCSQPNPGPRTGKDTQGCYLASVVTAAGSFSFVPDLSGMYLTAESNP